MIVFHDVVGVGFVVGVRDREADRRFGLVFEPVDTEGWRVDVAGAECQRPQDDQRRCDLPRRVELGERERPAV